MFFNIWQGDVMKNFAKFVYAVFCVILVWWVNMKFTHQGIDGWYNNVEKTIITPPNIVFPIVWTVLYTLLIASFYLILKNADNKQIIKANNWFWMQLVLQALWTFLFFAKGYIALAFVAIIVLDFAVYKMLNVFKTIHKISAYMNYPFYWCCYKFLVKKTLDSNATLKY